MALDYSTLVYLPSFDMFARPVTILPLASQPGMPQYGARGIFDTDDVNVFIEDGTIFADHKTFIDIREAEFSVVPEQLDQVFIPADVNAGRELGWYEVTDACTNGGGETTLTLRRIKTAKPQ
jgi:hypothetical protein